MGKILNQKSPGRLYEGHLKGSWTGFVEIPDTFIFTVCSISRFLLDIFSFFPLKVC